MVGCCLTRRCLTAPQRTCSPRRGRTVGRTRARHHRSGVGCCGITGGFASARSVGRATLCPLEQANSSALESEPASPTLAVRLHAWSGSFALSGFALIHLWVGLAPLWSVDAAQIAFQTQPRRSLPVTALLLLCVWVPLAWHAGYGIWQTSGLLTPQQRVRWRQEPKLRRRALSGISGLCVLAFLTWHWAGLVFPDGLLFGAAPDTFETLERQLASVDSWGIPVAATLYSLGSCLVLGHAAYGVCTSPLSARLRARYPRGFVRAIAAVAALTVVPMWLGVLHFATGWP